MDYTQIISAVIALISALVSAFLIPWLKTKIDADKLQTLRTYVEIGVKAAEQLCSLLPEDKVYDRNYPEEQRQRNLLALFPRGMMLSCGRVEKGEFVVENTCCAQDHVLDLPRMERMERALADFAKQEANKKEN